MELLIPYKEEPGDRYFYLGSDGVMETDSWIDDMYYVDINGVRVSNRWVYVELGTEDAPNSDGGWFYLDFNNGLARFVPFPRLFCVYRACGCIVPYSLQRKCG